MMVALPRPPFSALSHCLEWMSRIYSLVELPVLISGCPGNPAGRRVFLNSFSFIFPFLKEVGQLDDNYLKKAIF